MGQHLRPSRSTLVCIWWCMVQSSSIQRARDAHQIGLPMPCCMALRNDLTSWCLGAHCVGGSLHGMCVPWHMLACYTTFEKYELLHMRSPRQRGEVIRTPHAGMRFSVGVVCLQRPD